MKEGRKDLYLYHEALSGDRAYGSDIVLFSSI